MTAKPRLSTRRIRGLTVFLENLTVQAQIGVYAHEQGTAQPLVVDVEAELAPATIRSIDDTVDYDFIAAAAHRLAGEGHVALVEHYAERLADACLDDLRVQSVRVRVRKPNAVPGATAGVEIVVER